VNLALALLRQKSRYQSKDRCAEHPMQRRGFQSQTAMFYCHPFARPVGAPIQGLAPLPEVLPCVWILDSSGFFLAS